MNYQKYKKIFKTSLGYGDKACGAAILMDLGIQDIKLRILSEKEKYIARCELGLAPKIIMELYNNRNKKYKYEEKLIHDKDLEYGYPNVMRNGKRKKIKVKTQVYSYSEKNKKVILLKFTSNSPREAEGLRRRWIKHNLENWTKAIKPKETVFKSNNNERYYGVQKVIKVNFNDVEPVWAFIELINIRRVVAPKSIRDTQVEIWNKSQVGKVLRKYKKGWFYTPVVNNIPNRNMRNIRLMRVGGSRLNSHTNQHNKLCVVCKEIETNEHYLLHCKKYNQERVEMSTKIKPHLNKLRWNMTVDKMLGIFEESYKYIIKKKNRMKYSI